MRRHNRQQQGRPTHQPDYRITLAGRTISPELNARLVSMTLVDRRGFDSDQLDITLADHDGRLALPSRGAELTVAIGWRHTGLIDRGKFIVDEVEHSGPPDQLTIRARAADMREGLPVKRSQSWHEITLQDLIATIAARHELEPLVNAELADTWVEHLDQTDESDLNLLTRLGERYDADATIKSGRLLFLPRGGGVTAGGTAIPPVILTRQAGDRHRYTVTDRNSFSGVIAWWHDPDTAERWPVLVGSDENPKSLRGNHATEQEALAEAQAEWRRVRRAGSALTLSLAEGRADLYPETPVIARGWKPEIDATEWVAVEVVHTLSEGGYTGSVLCEAGAGDEVENGYGELLEG